MTTVTGRRRNADPNKCDCGNEHKLRVPVDAAVADMYGYDDVQPGDHVDVCNTCHHEMLCTGTIARVLDDIQAIQPDGTGRPLDYFEAWNVGHG